MSHISDLPGAIQQSLDSAALKAVALWGRDNQMLQAIEEMAELQQVLSKCVMGRPVALDKIAEEVVDVYITLHQIAPLVMGPGTFHSLMRTKLRKLCGHMDEAARVGRPGKQGGSVVVKKGGSDGG